jgi:CheY-like chemotaxis protein
MSDASRRSPSLVVEPVSAMKLLVVEDDSEMAGILEYIFARAGFTTCSAADPQTALDLIQTEDPDLIILDINLGKWSGFDLLESLGEHTDTPVLILTGREAEDDRVRALDLGTECGPLTSERTTTSSSLSATESWWPECGLCYGGGSGRRVPPRRPKVPRVLRVSRR